MDVLEANQQMIKHRADLHRQKATLQLEQLLQVRVADLHGIIKFAEAVGIHGLHNITQTNDVAMLQSG
jgi:hypothetical protein